MKEGLKKTGKIEVPPLLVFCTDWAWVNSRMC